MAILSFAEALGVVLAEAGRAAAVARGVETVPLLESAGRVLAERVLADRDQPPFDRSTRDGYAVRAAAVGGGLRVVGTVAAGETWRGGPLGAGEAVEIMTGAPVPDGLDAVMMVEHVVVEGESVRLAAGRGLKAVENVVPRGAEARKGAGVLAAGTVVGAAEIAVAASCGRAELPVYTRPAVAVVATGDELVELDVVPEASQIRNSNSYALAALVEREGGRAVRLGVAQDTRESVRERIAEGMRSDLLVLSGGVSMGKFDLVEEVLAEFGAEFFFTGALIQPGKPVVFGRLPRRAGGKSFPQGLKPASLASLNVRAEARTLQSAGSSAAIEARALQSAGSSAAIEARTLQSAGSSAASEARTLQSADSSAAEWIYFFGLPGNPVSTQVTFSLFVAPLLRALAGRAVVAPQFVEARLGERVAGGARVTRFLPAEMRGAWDGVTVSVVGWQGSGDVAANARGNCYCVLPAGVEGFVEGETVRVLLR